MTYSSAKNKKLSIKNTLSRQQQQDPEVLCQVDLKVIIKIVDLVLVDGGWGEGY